MKLNKISWGQNKSEFSKQNTPSKNKINKEVLHQGVFSYSMIITIQNFYL